MLRSQDRSLKRKESFQENLAIQKKGIQEYQFRQTHGYLDKPKSEEKVFTDSKRKVFSMEKQDQYEQIAKQNTKDYHKKNLNQKVYGILYGSLQRNQSSTKLGGNVKEEKRPNKIGDHPININKRTSEPVMFPVIKTRSQMLIEQLIEKQGCMKRSTSQNDNIHFGQKNDLIQKPLMENFAQKEDSQIIYTPKNEINLRKLTGKTNEFLQTRENSYSDSEKLQKESLKLSYFNASLNLYMNLKKMPQLTKDCYNFSQTSSNLLVKPKHKRAESKSFHISQGEVLKGFAEPRINKDILIQNRRNTNGSIQVKMPIGNEGTNTQEEQIYPEKQLMCYVNGQRKESHTLGPPFKKKCNLEEKESTSNPSFCIPQVNIIPITYFEPGKDSQTAKVFGRGSTPQKIRKSISTNATPISKFGGMEIDMEIKRKEISPTRQAYRKKQIELETQIIKDAKTSNQVQHISQHSPQSRSSNKFDYNAYLKLIKKEDWNPNQKYSNAFLGIDELTKQTAENEQSTKKDEETVLFQPKVKATKYMTSGLSREHQRSPKRWFVNQSEYPNNPWSGDNVVVEEASNNLQKDEISKIIQFKIGYGMNKKGINQYNGIKSKSDFNNLQPWEGDYNNDNYLLQYNTEQEQQNYQQYSNGYDELCKRYESTERERIQIYKYD